MADPKVTRGRRDVDIVIIGGGPAGYATALRAVTRKLSVALIAERAEVGGTCLHEGCVPSKALLHASATNAEFARLRGEGPILGEGLAIDDLQRLRRAVVARLHGGLLGLLKGSGIEMVEGRGRLDDDGIVTVDDGTTVHAGAIVIATGSRPRALPGVEIDGEVIVNSDAALTLGRIPRAPVIIGGGAVGVEFASMWNQMGASVTVIEVAERLLVGEDVATSDFLAQSLRRNGIQVLLSTNVRAVSKNGAESATIHLDDGSEIQTDLVLVCAGRVPNTAGTRADELGLTDDRGFIRVDPLGRTSRPGVWAVGDVIETLALAHAGFAEGFVVADAIAGLNPQPVDHHLIPRVTYSDPEVASVGLTEIEARERFGSIAVSVSSIAGNARALINDVQGQVKLVTTAGGELVGMHIVGPMATEMIGQAALATSWGAYIEEIAEVVMPHPTFGESIREALLAAAGLPFHGHRP